MARLFLRFALLLLLDSAASFSSIFHHRPSFLLIRLEQHPPSTRHSQQHSNTIRRRGLTTRLHLAAAANDNDEDLSFLDSDDPFRVLQLSSSPSSVNAKEIRKAYRRMAVRFHPDVTTNKDSSPAEKKRANDRFAKINWAYQTLSGKNQDGASNTAAGSRSTSSSSTAGGWTPPHRRTQSYSSPYSSSSSSSGGRASTDWRDYIPNYRKEQDNEMYDTNGDSFEAIFSDLFKAAGQGVMGGGGILKDFVEFLENEAGAAASSFGTGSSGFGSSSSSFGSSLDMELQQLLETGTIEQVAEEMDDTQLVEQQLETKLSNLRNDVISLTADLAVEDNFKDRIRNQEELASAKARIPVVENYLKQSRKRLLALQTRYKELIVQGKNDPKAGGRGGGGSVWDEIRNEARSSPSESSTSATDAQSKRRTEGSGSQRRATKEPGDDDDDAWKSDSFGSFGRGRGSSRGRASRGNRRRSQSYSTDSSPRSSSSYSSTSSSSTFSSASQRQPTQSSQSTPSQPTSPQTEVPPHRRASRTSRYDEDKRRLRELKVDEEFDKLKKELGL